MKIEPALKCSEIKNGLANLSANEIWDLWLPWAQTLVPFWKGAINAFADKTDLPPARREKYLATLENAFNLMDDWRYERIKYVKARRNEIDSAISFIRNTALDSRVSTLLMSPMSRNAAGVLRKTVYIAARGYRDDQMPLLIAKGIYSLAECRSFFPVDSSTLIPFLPPGKGLDGSSEAYSEDNYHLMLELAATRMGIEHDVKRLYEEAGIIWSSFREPVDMVLPDDLWQINTDGMSEDLYYAGMSAFHGKDTRSLNKR